MQGVPILTLTTFIPLVGVLFLFTIRQDSAGGDRNAWAVGILTSFVTFLLSCVLFFSFDASKSDFQFVEKYAWISDLNVYYHMGVDGISVLFVMLSTLLIPLALLASMQSVKIRVREYVISFLILETMMIGTFCAMDLVLFYLFFEGVLIPMFLIIGIWGGARRVYSALKFFLYTFFGSVFMLIAVISLYYLTGTMTISELSDHVLPFHHQAWLWWAFFASFAIKVPMWPFHTWLPDAHVEAPTAGSVILAGVLLKMGGYGFLRFSLPIFPEASQYFANFIFILSIIGVIYTSLVAFAQKDIKKLIAYSSVAHMGLVTFGTFTFSLEGVQGAIFQMISHGIVSAALFLCVGVIYDRIHSRAIVDYGGLVHRMPYYAVAFMVFMLAGIGLPGTSGFIGEILVILSAYQISAWLALGVGMGMILGAGYGLWLYRRVVLGPLEKENLKKILDLTPVERFVFAPLLILVFVLGVYPKPILKTSERASLQVLSPYQKAKVILRKGELVP